MQGSMSPCNSSILTIPLKTLRVTVNISFLQIISIQFTGLHDDYEGASAYWLIKMRTKFTAISPLVRRYERITHNLVLYSKHTE